MKVKKTNKMRSLADYVRASPRPPAELWLQPLPVLMADPIWQATLPGPSDQRRKTVTVVDECIRWEGADNGNGHAMYNGHPAYRLYYEYFVGPIPPGHEIHHRCQNGRCVRPSHLQPVTANEHRNEHRKVNRRRKRKLSAEDVLTILGLREAGYTLTETARRFGITHTMVYLIELGLRWSDVTRRRMPRTA